MQSPCLLESEEDAFLVAKTITENLPEGVDYYFKASFDKANRSSHKSFRGHGLRFAIKIFEKLRDAGYKVITDVHEPQDVAILSNYVDAYQVPAFFVSSERPAIQAVAESGKLVNVKKGQFMSPRQAIL